MKSPQFRYDGRPYGGNSYESSRIFRLSLVSAQPRPQALSPLHWDREERAWKRDWPPPRQMTTGNASAFWEDPMGVAFWYQFLSASPEMLRLSFCSQNGGVRKRPCLCFEGCRLDSSARSSLFQWVPVRNEQKTFVLLSGCFSFWRLLSFWGLLQFKKNNNFVLIRQTTKIETNGMLSGRNKWPL